MNSAIYFDQSSTSYPKPPEMLESMARYLSEYGVSPGKGSYDLAESANAVVHSVREQLASLLSIKDAHSIAFTHNATHALNIIIKGFLKPGDHVILSNFEHNSAFRPVHRLYREQGVSYSIWESDKEGFFCTKALAALIQPHTRLLILNHASNVLGVISPVADALRIAKAHGIRLLLDVSQTAGLIPTPFGEEVDFIAGTGHKTLLGPPGIGFLYIKEPALVQSLYEGGSGDASFSPYQPEYTPDKFEAGTLNYLGIAGLQGSLHYLHAYGMNRIYSEVMSLTQYAFTALSQLPGIILYGTNDFTQKLPLISFNLDHYFPGELGYLFNQKEIAVRTGLQCAPLIHKTLSTFPKGTVRLSFGHQNTHAEVERLITELTHLTRGKHA